MSHEPDMPETIVTTRPKEKTQSRTRRFPPYHVILENDDFHSFEFVIDVVQKVFGYPFEPAFLLTKEAHESNRSVVWTGPKEVAELKVEQISSYHEVRESDNKKLGPVGCCIEPAPG